MVLSSKSTNQRTIKTATDVVEATSFELYKLFAHSKILIIKSSKTTCGINPNVYNNVKLRQINELSVVYQDPSEKILSIYNNVRKG